ncbi:Neuroparsin-A [Chionoecetes opilio]|uniref:Neuroparsin-A n=1 Tax=Chionoecetes opilio TaxID=41210 RepID=A0A8J4YKT8_CHIOP|nr:Neuroparsin-A [Chionoecetes opilio]
MTKAGVLLGAEPPEVAHRPDQETLKMTSCFRAAALVLVFSCLLLLLQEGSAAPRCQDYDQPAPKNCKYGTTVDWCNNGVCAKGPGETCGGYRWSAGKCGEGTFCSCGICGGCSPYDGRCGDVVSPC